jgi:purine-nucleoside phosphorylase
MDLETFGISVITDIGDDNIDTISHDEVLEAAKGGAECKKFN